MSAVAGGAAAGAAAGSVVPGIGTAVGALGGAALGAIGSIFNNERNLASQREAQDYNKWAQQVTWQREDSAVQRRVADLRAAGLSPVLAAGSSAQAGSPTKIDPVVSEDALGAQGFMSGMTRAAQTQQTIAATEAAVQQANLLKANVGKTQMETAVLGKELGLYNLPPGHPKYQDVWGKRLSSLGQLIKNSKVMPTVEEREQFRKESEARFDKNLQEAGKTPAERAKARGKWHLFNEF